MYLCLFFPLRLLVEIFKIFNKTKGQKNIKHRYISIKINNELIDKVNPLVNFIALLVLMKVSFLLMKVLMKEVSKYL